MRAIKLRLLVMGVILFVLGLYLYLDRGHTYVDLGISGIGIFFLFLGLVVK